MVVGTQKCFRLSCIDFWWMNHGATKRPNQFANWLDLFQTQTALKVLREKRHISGMASEWMPEYMCLSFPWCPKVCGVSFCQIPVRNDSEIACVSERNLLNTCMQFLCRLNTVSKTTCVLWQFDKTTCRLLTALKEKNIETAYELHTKDVLIFDHCLVNISPIFGSSFNQTEGERHYIKDASLAQKSQHARRFLPNKGSAANKKFNMFGWNTLEMICTVDGLTHPPHRLPTHSISNLTYKHKTPDPSQLYIYMISWHYHLLWIVSWGKLTWICKTHGLPKKTIYTFMVAFPRLFVCWQFTDGKSRIFHKTINPFFWLLAPVVFSGLPPWPAVLRPPLRAPSPPSEKGTKLAVEKLVTWR